MNIIIVGAGLAGLTTAYKIQRYCLQRKLQAQIKLLEGSKHVGGVIQTEMRDDFLLEKGPDCFISEKPAALELVKELQIESELIGTQEEFRRSFILRGSKLYPVPEGLYLMAPSAILPFIKSPMVSWRGKIRMLLEPLIPPSKQSVDESLGSFVRRRLGTEALERIAQPMIAGIYSADPERLSLKATMPQFLEMERQYKSVIRALMAKRITRKNEKGTSGPRYSLFLSFKKGMFTLIDALQKSLGPEIIQTNSVVTKINKESGKWIIGLASGQNLKSNVLCIALPAPKCSPLLQNQAPEIARILEQIEYTSIAIINFGYKKKTDWSSS